MVKKDVLLLFYISQFKSHFRAFDKNPVLIYTTCVMPKRTYQPKKLKRKRKHGFLARNRSSGGQSIIKRRRVKGRKKLSE